MQTLKLAVTVKLSKSLDRFSPPKSLPWLPFYGNTKCACMMLLICSQFAFPAPASNDKGVDKLSVVWFWWIGKIGTSSQVLRFSIFIPSKWELKQSTIWERNSKSHQIWKLKIEIKGWCNFLHNVPEWCFCASLTMPGHAPDEIGDCAFGSWTICSIILQ